MRTVCNQLRRVIDVAFGVFLLAVLATAVALIGVPAVVGGTSLTVLTGSMEPVIKPGDVVATHGVNPANQNTFQVGDVIAFLPYPHDPTVVIHRVIAVQVRDGVTYYTTKGDNNDVADAWGPVPADHVRGKVMYVVPLVGFAREWVAGHIPAAGTVMGLGLVGYGLVALGLSFRRPGSARRRSRPRRARLAAE